MEKPLKDLSILISYQNRQVILNYYHDEEMLYHRDGFCFQTIQLTENSLTLTKKNGNITTIKRKEYPEAYINTDFQNYYTLRSDIKKLEIYFP